MAVGYLLSFACGLAISFALVSSIAKFFAGDVSDRSEPGDDTFDI